MTTDPQKPFRELIAAAKKCSHAHWALVIDEDPLFEELDSRVAAAEAALPTLAGKKNFFDLSTEERHAIMNKSLEGMSP